MVATVGELRHISNKSPYNGIKPIQYQAFANFFVARLNIIIEAEGCSNLKKVIDYLHLYPDKVGQTFLRIFKGSRVLLRLVCSRLKLTTFFTGSWRLKPTYFILSRLSSS